MYLEKRLRLPVVLAITWFFSQINSYSLYDKPQLHSWELHVKTHIEWNKKLCNFVPMSELKVLLLISVIMWGF